MIPAFGVGELAAIIALFVMFIGGETVQRPEPLRTVLGCIHGLLVFAGLELALATSRWDPAWMAFVCGLGNVFNFVVVAAMLSIVFPQRREDGSTLPMWETLLGPLVMAMVWGTSSALARGASPLDVDILESSLLLLGLHYYLVCGMIIVMLLLNPPGHAAAASLPLRDRLRSGFGMFWIVLMVLWWGQLWFPIRTHATALFGGSWWTAVLAVALSVPLIVRNARYGHAQIHG